MGSRSKQGVGQRAAKDLEGRVQRWAKEIADKLVVVEQGVGEAGQQLAALGARLEKLEGRADDCEEVAEGDGDRLGLLERQMIEQVKRAGHLEERARISEDSHGPWAKQVDDRLRDLETITTDLPDRVANLELVVGAAGDDKVATMGDVRAVASDVAEIQGRLPAAPVRLATSVLVETLAESVKEVRATVDELGERMSAVEAEQIDAAADLSPADEAAIRELEDGPSDDDLDDEEAPFCALPSSPAPAPAPGDGEVNHGGTCWVSAPGVRGGSLGVRLTDVAADGWRAVVESPGAGFDVPGPARVQRVQVIAETRQGAIDMVLAEARRAWPALFAAAAAAADPTPLEAQEQLALHSEPAGSAGPAAAPAAAAAAEEPVAMPGGVRIVGGRVVES